VTVKKPISGPNNNPKTGEIKVDPSIKLLVNPITGKTFNRDINVYRGAKDAIKATLLADSRVFLDL